MIGWLILLSGILTSLGYLMLKSNYFIRNFIFSVKGIWGDTLNRMGGAMTEDEISGLDRHYRYSFRFYS